MPPRLRLRVGLSRFALSLANCARLTPVPLQCSPPFGSLTPSRLPALLAAAYGLRGVEIEPTHQGDDIRLAPSLCFALFHEPFNN